MLKESVIKKAVAQGEVLKVFEETGVLSEGAKIRSAIKILPDFKYDKVIIKGSVDKLFVDRKHLFSLEIKKGARVGCIDVCDGGQINGLLIYGRVDYLKVYDRGKILTVRICPKGSLGGAISEDPVTIMQLFLQGVKIYVLRTVIEKKLESMIDTLRRMIS